MIRERLLLGQWDMKVVGVRKIHGGGGGMPTKGEVRRAVMLQGSGSEAGGVDKVVIETVEQRGNN